MQVARQSDRGQNGGFPWVGCYTVSNQFSRVCYELYPVTD
jgi:hypothetical protein